ncbi:caspase family protein [Candidatus Woesearchaeota archaeon]|nr:caspase family protein [Candidatus Woesearchaeota archaeon]
MFSWPSLSGAWLAAMLSQGSLKSDIQTPEENESVRYALIMTGSTRGESGLYLADPLDRNFFSLSGARVYDSLRELGFQPENVRVLHPGQPSFDDPMEARAFAALQEEQFNGTYDTEATQQNLMDILDEFTVRIDDNDIFVVYLGTHGAPSFLEMERDFPLTNAFIQERLGKIRPGLGILYLDSCSSGTFIRSLDLPEYVLISLTGDMLGWGDRYFSGGAYFFENLNDPEADANVDGHVTIEEAFILADREAAEHRKRIEPYLLEQYNWQGADPAVAITQFSVQPTMIRGEKTDPDFSFVEWLW